MIFKKKIGIYGGTFNPPHIGHIRAAESFVSAIGLDELLIMPDFLPPHKSFEAVVSPKDRLEMCRRAFSHIDKAVISPLEINRGGKSYTAVTLEKLYSSDRELFFLCGTDMFLTLEQWFSFKKIFELATICCVRRENNEEISNKILMFAERYRNKYNAEIVFIHIDIVEISSTDLRSALSTDTSCKELLSPEVYEYIKVKGLYK